MSFYFPTPRVTAAEIEIRIDQIRFDMERGYGSTSYLNTPAEQTQEIARLQKMLESVR